MLHVVDRGHEAVCIRHGWTLLSKKHTIRRPASVKQLNISTNPLKFPRLPSQACEGLHLISCSFSSRLLSSELQLLGNQLILALHN